MEKLIKCKKCGHEVSKTAKTCPNCGAKVPKFTWWQIALSIVIFFVLIGIFSPKSNNSSVNSIKDSKSQKQEQQNNTKNKETVVAKDDLELLDWDWSNDEYYKYLVGKIKNNTEKTYSYAQIEFNLYDKDDAQIGTAVANIQNLEPGKIWKFKAIVLEKETKTAKIKGITGY